MELLIAAAGVFAILAASQILWRQKIIKDEVARKFVHILVGIFVAFWPYFMSWQQIVCMSLLLLVGVVVSRYGNVFKAVHGVSRKTQGDVLFPVGIGLSALLMPAPIIFTAAILHVALADGLAAVIGKQYGSFRYTIRNHVKSFVGSAVFYITSTLIIVAVIIVSGATITWPVVPLIIWLPLAATVVENMAIGGLDNIFVPLLIIVALQAAQIN